MFPRDALASKPKPEHDSGNQGAAMPELDDFFFWMLSGKERVEAKSSLNAAVSEASASLICFSSVN